MPDGRPYGVGSAVDTDPRRRRMLQVTQGFLNQGPASAGAEPRTRPSTYPDVRGFASTPVGKMLLRNIMARMQGARGQAQQRPIRR